MELKVGELAPDFTLASTTGKDFTLSKDAYGKPTILYFYPKDFSPVCTTEACAFRDTFDFFSRLKIAVYGISRDTIETHLKFKDIYKLQFELLSDRSGKVSKLYNTFTPMYNFTKISNFTKRVTILLNKENKIAAIHQNYLTAKSHIESMKEEIELTL
jgi:peroxiredoxin Q/BCP